MNKMENEEKWKNAFKNNFFTFDERFKKICLLILGLGCLAFAYNFGLRIFLWVLALEIAGYLLYEKVKEVTDTHVFGAVIIGMFFLAIILGIFYGVGHLAGDFTVLLFDGKPTFEGYALVGGGTLGAILLIVGAVCALIEYVRKVWKNIPDFIVRCLKWLIILTLAIGCVWGLYLLGSLIA